MKEIKISKDIVIRHVKLSDAQIFFDAEQDSDAKKNFMRTPLYVGNVEEDTKKRNLHRKSLQFYIRVILRVGLILIN